MQFCKLLDLEIGGEGCGDIKITANSVELKVGFNGAKKGVLSFDDVTAFRFSDEYHSDFVAESYDVVIEILESDWKRELALVEPSRIRGGIGGKHHYAVFFSNNGYLEVISTSYDLNYLPD